MIKVDKSRINKAIARLGSESIYDGIILIVPLVYVVLVSGYLLYRQTWFAPDQFFGFAILGVILIGRVKQFLWDWVPMMLLFFGYEYLRGLVPLFTQHAHVLPMIAADNLLFGFIPTIKLQALLFTSTHLHWYDYFSVILYLSHFVIPWAVAFVFWLYDRKYFKQYSSAFLLLSYLAYVTFSVFPAVPPWMASAQGYLPALNKIMDQVLSSLNHSISVPTIYQLTGANLVAAFPSLHAAYPWLTFLFISKKFKIVGYFMLLYVFSVWLAVIYLGEHYVVDVIAGIIYASFAYLVVEYMSKLQLRKQLLTLKSNSTELTPTSRT